MSMNNTF